MRRLIASGAFSADQRVAVSLTKSTARRHRALGTTPCLAVYRRGVSLYAMSELLVKVTHLEALLMRGATIW